MGFHAASEAMLSGPFDFAGLISAFSRHEAIVANIKSFYQDFVDFRGWRNVDKSSKYGSLLPFKFLPWEVNDERR